jgi:hypothetical protein
MGNEEIVQSTVHVMALSFGLNVGLTGIGGCMILSCWEIYTNDCTTTFFGSTSHRACPCALLFGLYVNFGANVVFLNRTSQHAYPVIAAEDEPQRYSSSPESLLSPSRTSHQLL